MPRFRYLDENRALRFAEIGPERFVIGRGNTADIEVQDDLASREHAQVERDPDGHLRLRDLGSRNKTFVNGQMITETLLSSGDLVRIGHWVMEFLDDGPVEAVPDPQFMTPDRTDPPGTEWIKCKTPTTLSADQLARLALMRVEELAMARMEDIADTALSHLLVNLKADRGLVALRGEHKREIKPLAQRGLTKTPAGLTPVSQTFVLSCLLQQVAGRYPAQAVKTDQKEGYAVTAMVAPLLFGTDVVGLVYVDRPHARQAFSAVALQFLIAGGIQLGALMSDALDRMRETAPREGMAWMNTLRSMQKAMTTPPTNEGSLTVSWKMVAGQGRCGDFADVYHVDEHRALVTLLDAGGQGVLGLAQAQAIKLAVRAAFPASAEVIELAPLFASLNSAMASLPGRRLVAGVVVALDLSAGRVSYINAGGMPPILMAGPKRLLTLDQPALLLGIDRDYIYEETTLDLPPRFRLLCHTDGVVESGDGSGEAFGEARLHDLLLDPASFGDPSEIVDRIISAIEAHRGGAAADDDALVCVVGN